MAVWRAHLHVLFMHQIRHNEKTRMIHDHQLKGKIRRGTETYIYVQYTTILYAQLVGKAGSLRFLVRSTGCVKGESGGVEWPMPHFPEQKIHGRHSGDKLQRKSRRDTENMETEDADLRRGLFTTINTADNLPSPVDVVRLMKANGITAVRLFEPNHDIYEALKGTSIKVSVGVLNDDLPGLASASISATSGWLETHVLPFINDVSFAYITLGNEAIPGPKAQYVYTAIQNMWTSLETFNLSSQILPTVVVPGGVLGVSYPPSQGAFADNVADIMTDVTKLVYSIGAPLMVNVYPYFALVSTPNILVHLSHSSLRRTQGSSMEN
ncbi:hypothetical protein Syun_007402 [Stephania yunnanensis]|uniref:Glucan endo-1,3-beta-D-glucosidase n=1 Tax=Stephania yunnanensis TaxID=152371 RepID=A0AAP0KYJ1_9MAGN